MKTSPGQAASCPSSRPNHSSENEDPLKITKESVSCSVQTPAQKKRVGEIVSIFHINTDLTAAARNAWVTQRADDDYRTNRAPAQNRYETLQRRNSSDGRLYGDTFVFMYFKMALKKKKIICPFLWDSNVFCSRGSAWKRLSNVKPYAKVTGDFVLVTYCNCILSASSSSPSPGPQLLHTVVEFSSALDKSGFTAGPCS